MKPVSRRRFKIFKSIILDKKQKGRYYGVRKYLPAKRIRWRYEADL